jgi:2'-5' RNA ligase
VLRLFAALPVPGDIAARLEGLQHGLEGRRVEPGSMHVTLSFFGEHPEPVAADLAGALSRIAAPSFALWLDGAGAFGKAKPHLLYAAVRPEPALERLQAKVVQAARSAGIALPAARYVPHVTLARFAAGAVSPDRAARLIEARGAFLAGPMAVERFCLYRSELGRGGPVYTELASFALRARDGAHAQV